MTDKLLKPERMVCDCYKLKVSDLQAEIERGNNTFEAMVSSIRLGVLCSACIEDAKRVISALNENLDKRAD